MVRNLYATAINWDDVGTSLGGNLLGHSIGTVDHTQHQNIVADAHTAVGALIAHKTSAHTAALAFFRNSSA